MELLGQTLEEEASKIREELMGNKAVLLYARSQRRQQLDALEQMYSAVTQSVQNGNLRRGVKYLGAMIQIKEGLMAEESVAIDYFTKQLIPLSTP